LIWEGSRVGVVTMILGVRFSTTCSILPTPSGRAFTTTGTYKPLIRRALRLLKAEPSEELVGLGIKYFEELYEYLREEVGGIEPWRYATSIAIAAAAMAKVEKLGVPPNFMKVELRIRGLERIYDALGLEKFINKVKINKAKN